MARSKGRTSKRRRSGCGFDRVSHPVVHILDRSRHRNCARARHPTRSTSSVSAFACGGCPRALPRPACQAAPNDPARTAAASSRRARRARSKLRHRRRARVRSASHRGVAARAPAARVAAAIAAAAAQATAATAAARWAMAMVAAAARVAATATPMAAATAPATAAELQAARGTPASDPHVVVQASRERHRLRVLPPTRAPRG